MRDWENCYRNGETPWDKGGAAPPLLELIGRHGAEIFGAGPVLVPGCGLGHDVRALAAIGLPVLGLDIAETAVEKARAISPIGEETYEMGDYLAPEWCAGREFTAIWEHTCFCAINPSQRQAYAVSAATVLGGGAVLAAVFYLTPNDPGEEMDGPPFNSSIEEIEELFAPWFERIDAWVPETVYPGREGKEWVAIFRRLPHVRVAG
jgi:methyl halide transferase